VFSWLLSLQQALWIRDIMVDQSAELRDKQTRANIWNMLSSDPTRVRPRIYAQRHRHCHM